MTFLAPITGIIAASITLPLLTLLYFLKLRRKPIRVSSTMLWKQAAQDLQVNAPFRWLRISLLLILQTLALLSLAGALARPAIDEGRAPPGRLIIVIDASASMSAPAAEQVDSTGDKPMTRLDDAKEKASELVNRLGRLSASGRSPEAMVISFAARAQAMTNFTSDRTVLQRAIRSIDPTDQPGELDSALALVEAQSLQSDSAQAESSTRVVIFSDGDLTRSDKASRAGFGGAQAQFIRTGPAPQAPRDNLGVVALSAARDYEDPSLVRLFTRIQNAGPDAIETTLTLAIEGVRLTGKQITVPGASEGVPGSVGATFETRSITGGALTLTIDRADELASDNVAALALAPPRTGRVLLVEPTLRSSGAASIASRALRRILDELSGGRVSEMNIAAYDEATRGQGALSRIDLVVFDNVRPRELPPVASISFGATPKIPGLSSQAPEEASNTSERFMSWLRTHPALRSVGLDSVVVSDPLRLIITPDQADAKITPIAWGETGPLIVEVDSASLRRLIVAFPLVQSTWTLRPSFVVFMANAVNHLARRGEGETGRSYTTADAVSVRVKPGVDHVSVEGPISFDASVLDRDGGVAALGALPIAGVYRVNGAVDDDSIVAVNLANAQESAIATTSRIDMAGRRIAAGGLGQAAPREIWQWFVLAGLALLLIEWLVYAWRMRV